MKKFIKTSVRVALASTMVLGATVVLAQGTPDWQTPAMETVCDAEPSPGRGLCVAYCEAMDCDDDPNANQNACDNVKAKWQNKTGGTNLPCEISCPCNDIPGYADLVSGETPSTQCLVSTVSEFNGIAIGSDIFGGTGEFAVTSLQEPDVGTCVYINTNTEEFFALPTTVDEQQACYDQLAAAAAAQSLTCDPV